MAEDRDGAHSMAGIGGGVRGGREGAAGERAGWSVTALGEADDAGELEHVAVGCGDEGPRAAQSSCKATGSGP